MGAYNLYLLDGTRDPKVITRLARITGLAESLVRRELKHPPFLILKEHGLSQAVAVRRELELVGLSLRLELVERPTGDRSHPLAGEQAPPEGEEIVLEEGRGFVEAGRIDDNLQAPTVTQSATARRSWSRVALATLALLSLLAAWWLGRGSAGSGGAMDDASLESASARIRTEVPALLEALDAQLAQPQDARLPDLLQQVEALDAALRPMWEELPARDRQAVEDLLARRQTLLLRSGGAARSTSAVWTPQDLNPPQWKGAGPESFWQQAERALSSESTPISLGAQLALERLDDELKAIARSRDTQARARLSQLEAANPGARERLGAIRLSGSLQQKGVVWTGEGAARQGWADLPDSTVLEVESAGVVVEKAVVTGGRLVFPADRSSLENVSLRLAALDRQPGPLRRILESGLQFIEPELFFGTIPGSRLPRLDPGAAAAQWAQHGDPALKAELRRLGLVGEDTRWPVLAPDLKQFGQSPDLRDWLLAAAERYRKARSWPQRLELRTPQGRFHISGCELWLLTRQS